MGLFIGVSFLSFIELIELAYKLIRIFASEKKTKPIEDNVVSSSDTPTALFRHH